jgi:hypothetical protein
VRSGRILTAAAILAAGGCSALTPFATSPLPVPKGVTEPGPRVAICYNGMKTSQEQVQLLAEAECDSGSVAEPVDTDYRLDNCPLVEPARATFVCKPKK